MYGGLANPLSLDIDDLNGSESLKLFKNGHKIFKTLAHQLKILKMISTFRRLNDICIVFFYVMAIVWFYPL